MRIKRIDLLGFKSFCDKMSIDFRQAITCVVGPNGCGKSNIVDALRWSMGEQSARHLRGKNMEDVIFNGSDTRGPSGMAEVSITFENDGMAPPEYMGYNEITVTRRLFRDGTSEYLINKTPMRLKDVTNLFLGTGVGTKAYSIIEQGRIGLIVSAKPEDRRHFIEEAAGITKFQRKKQAAERKMEATQQNLLRVSDVLRELGQQIGRLRRQAQKAERFKQYKNEMRDLDMWVWSHKLLELMAEQKFHAGMLLDVEQRRQETLHDIEHRDIELEAMRLHVMDCEQKVSELQRELYEIDNRIQLNESNIEFQSRESEDLERRAADAHLECEALKKQLAESEVQLEQTKAAALKLEQTREELGAQLDDREQVLANLRSEAEKVQRALEDGRSAVARAEQARARAEASLVAIAKRRTEAEERIGRCNEEMARLLDKVTGLKSEAAGLEGRLEGLRSTVEQLEMRREDAQKRLAELEEESERGEAQLEVLRTEMHRRRSRLMSLKEIEQRYERFSSGTREIMQKHQGDNQTEKGLGIMGLVADMLETPSNYETALEAVLGSRLGTIVVEENHVGLEAIQYLKDNAKGRGSFIAQNARPSRVLQEAPVGFIWEPGQAPADTVNADGMSFSAAGMHGPMLHLVQYTPEFKRVAESILNDILVVDNLENALSLWDKVENKTLVTLDGEILEPDGTITGGTKDAETSGILRQKREIKELSEILDELEVQYQQALNSHVSVKTEIASLERVLEEVTHEGHQGDKDILTSEKDLSRNRSEIEAVNSRQGELTWEMEQARRLFDELEVEENSQQQQISEANSQIAEREAELELWGQERPRLGSLIDEAARVVTQLKVELGQTEANWISIEETRERLEEMRAEKTSRMARLEETAAEGITRAQELRGKVESMREELALLISERAQVEDRLNEGRNEYQLRHAEVSEAETILKQKRSLDNELAAQVTEGQLKSSNLKRDLEMLDQQCWDKYRESLRRVAGDYHQRPAVTEDDLEQLRVLRERIERYGEVNLLAIEEFQEVNERYEFLSTHKEDLEKALEQLRGAIRKINHTSRQRFKETFELVNAKFQEVFPRLFKGGKAQLVLTDPEKILETGVEIVAQPPGKKLQSIELLSGGEKALTAVSLIFSMFLVKPTPFCLLDEVDAPLDEANVTRFNDLVREISKSSQFIIITHNRRTMEIGDRLYGVTMEEPGISKMVSVNLSTEQSSAAAA